MLFKNNRSLVWEYEETHELTLWAKCTGTDY
jgi:hypothetical protein